VLEPQVLAPDNPDALLGSGSAKRRPGRVESDYSLTSQQLSGPDSSCARHVSYANLLVKTILQENSSRAVPSGRMSGSSSYASFGLRDSLHHSSLAAGTEADESKDSDESESGSAGLDTGLSPFPPDPLDLEGLRGFDFDSPEEEGSGGGSSSEDEESQFEFERDSPLEEPPRPPQLVPRSASESRPVKTQVASKLDIFLVGYGLEMQLAKLYQVGPAELDFSSSPTSMVVYCCGIERCGLKSLVMSFWA